MMPGESMTLNFTVHNEGNGLDIFHIRVGNIEELENAGFFVSLSENELLLERKSYGAVEVTIVAPSIREGNWVTTDSEGNDVPFTLVLTATSNHSIRGSLDVGLAMSQSLQMAINVEGLTDVAPACKKSGVDLVGPTILSLGIVSLLCAALYVRKT